MIEWEEMDSIEGEHSLQDLNVGLVGVGFAMVFFFTFAMFMARVIVEKGLIPQTMIHLLLFIIFSMSFLVGLRMFLYKRKNPYISMEIGRRGFRYVTLDKTSEYLWSDVLGGYLDEWTPILRVQGPADKKEQLFELPPGPVGQRIVEICKARGLYFSSPSINP